MYKQLAILFLAFAFSNCQPATAEKKVEEKVSEEKTADETKYVDTTTPKVTGIGGIFFKTKHPDQMKRWYGDNLGLAVGEHGSPFEFRNAHRPEEINYLNWDVFPKDTDYFDPSTQPFMINYRVQNIEALVEKLKNNGIRVVDTIAAYPYGKFVHILDPEDNKIELWEPVDSFLTELGGPTTK